MSLLDAIADLLEQRCFRGDSEGQLQVAVEALLHRACEGELGRSFMVSSEVALGRYGGVDYGRIDFVVSTFVETPKMLAKRESAIGVELKVEGSLAAVTSQLHRYAQSDLDALLLVTTRQKHRRVPRLLNGKPVRVAYLSPL